MSTARILQSQSELSLVDQILTATKISRPKNSVQQKDEKQNSKIDAAIKKAQALIKSYQFVTNQHYFESKDLNNDGVGVLHCQDEFYIILENQQKNPSVYSSIETKDTMQKSIYGTYLGFHQSADNKKEVIIKILQSDNVNPNEFLALEKTNITIKKIILVHNNNITQFLILKKIPGQELDFVRDTRIVKCAMDCLSDLSILLENNLTHSDIYPANIIFNPIDGSSRLVDFGASQAQGTVVEDFIRPGIPLLQPPYHSKMVSAPRLDIAADIYSLGMSLALSMQIYVVDVTKRDIYENIHWTGLSDISTEASLALKKIILRMLEPNEKLRISLNECIKAFSDFKRVYIDKQTFNLATECHQQAPQKSMTSEIKSPHLEFKIS